MLSVWLYKLMLTAYIYRYVYCCSQPTSFDVLFVIDTSASVKVSPGRWDAMKAFVGDIIDNFAITTNDIRVGVIRYGSFPVTSIELHDTYVRATLDAMTVVGGVTDTHEAILEANNKFVGEATSRKLVHPNLMVVITDGESGDWVATKSYSDSARATGTYLFSVGIALTRTAQLQDISNNPDYIFIISASKNTDLSALVTKLANNMCAVAVAAKGPGSIGDTCTIDADCSNLTNTACLSGKCLCITPQHFYRISTHGCDLRNIGDICTNDTNCANYTDGTCRSGVCGCPVNFASVSATNFCQNCTLGFNCDGTANCDAILPNSRCNTDNTLSCDPTYIETDAHTCIQRLLKVHNCSTNDDCDIAHAICEAGVCVCKTAYKESSNLRSCMATVVGGTCKSDADCGTVVGSTCINGICGCKVGFLRNGYSCRPRLLTKDVCSTDADCYGGVPNSFCIKALCTNTSCVGLCVCNHGFLTNLVQNSCRDVYIGSSCTNTSDCIVGVKQSECQNLICQCQSGYHMEPSRKNCSQLLLGGKCAVTDSCMTAVANSNCHNGVCACDHGWMKKSDDECIAVVLGAGPCNLNTDCSQVIKDGECMHNVCKCNEGFHELNSTNCKVNPPVVNLGGTNVGLIIGLVVGALVIIAAAVGGALGIFMRLNKGGGLPDAMQATDRLLRAVEQLDPELVCGSAAGEVVGQPPIKSVYRQS